MTTGSRRLGVMRSERDFEGTGGEALRSKQLFDLQPDAKSQVTVQYIDGKPIGCTKVVVSTQHNAETRNGKKYSPAMVKDLIGDAVEARFSPVRQFR